jgi:hypothetical protein
MVLISTVVGGLVLYVIFERYLKKARHRTQVGHKAIETCTLITAIVAAGLAASSLAYTLTSTGALEERVMALEKAARNLPQARQ